MRFRALSTRFAHLGMFAAFGMALVCAGPALAGDKAAAACPGGYAAKFKLVGQVTTPKTFTDLSWSAYRSAKQNVAYYSGSAGLVEKSYTGVPLIDLLNEAGIVIDLAHKNDILRKYVVVQGSDCYEAVIAVADLLPKFGGQQVTVAFATGDGTALDLTEGMARLIVPGDKAGGRFVSNIQRIEVRSAP